MNDLEDLVRRELGARVDEAEAAAAVEQPVALLADLDGRIRRARLRIRWRVSALSAVAIAAAIVLPLTLLSPGPAQTNPVLGGPGPSLPLTDTAATPTGWVPVAYGNAQISVPTDWQVSGRPVCGRVDHGYVVIGTASTSLAVRNPRCKQASNMAAIQVLPADQGQTHRRTGQINGIPLLGVRPVARGYASFLAPTLHVVITVRGPLATKVLGTLTRSPLSVVLAPGPQFPVPRSWRWHDFGGIRFATPAQWRTIKSRIWYPCWWVMTSAWAVKLIKATRAVAFHCVPPPDIAGAMRPRDGVVVGAGRYAALYQPASLGCRSLHGLSACLAMPGPGRLLELAVYVPGRHKPTVVDVGLTGNGAEARTIVESIRPR
jgi:hypothetical protein